MDDLLLCPLSYALAIQHTIAFLNFLSGHGYRMSLTIAHIASLEVKYLGLTLTPTTYSITSDHKALLHDLQEPTTKQQVLSIIVLANFFHLLIPNFATIAQPLYKVSKGSLLFSVGTT